MRDHTHVQMEMAGESATVYVHGLPDHALSASIVALCAELPPHVRTLRLDLRGIGAMSGEATNAVRCLLGHWRTTRGGEFRLITSHLLATWTPARSLAAPIAPPPAMRAQNEAAAALL